MPDLRKKLGDAEGQSVLSDDDLLALFQQQPEKAWRAFIDKHANTIFSLLHSLGFDYDQAMDRFVYVCEKLTEKNFRRLKAIRYSGSYGDLTPWLRQVARRLSVNWAWTEEGRKRLLKPIAQLGPNSPHLPVHVLIPQSAPGGAARQLWRASGLREAQRMKRVLLLCGFVLLLSSLSLVANRAKAEDRPHSGIRVRLNDSGPSYARSSTVHEISQDKTIYKVVVKHEGQYSIWPADRENPFGWDDVGKSGTKEELFAYIATIREKMRPTPIPSATPTVSSSPAPNNLQIPAIGQAGRPVEIKGPFDGDVRTTEIRIGGQLVSALAESSQSCFFISPEQNFGLNEITVRENKVETKGTYRNIGVRLSAPKTNLLKGESTTVTITVEGLKGIQQNVPLLIEKKGDVSIEGGDVQTVLIRPNDVVILSTESRADVRKVVIGLRPGFFNITATVIDPTRRPIIIPLIENGGVNGYRVKKDGTGFVINVENVKHPITGDPVDGEHKLEHQCPKLSKIPYVSRLFLNKGTGKTDGKCLTIMVTARIIIQNEN